MLCGANISTVGSMQSDKLCLSTLSNELTKLAKHQDRKNTYFYLFVSEKYTCRPDFNFKLI